jgi:4-diphosphocytidyl-2-C-methyl-D-erythritol kinase
MTAAADAAFAAAKVNLFLHVGPRADDGYHAIESLIVFADIGDRLRIGKPGDPPLSIEGPFAAGLTAGPDNLVLKASAALGEAAPLILEKHLPLAAGLGGGSADAAGALRLLNARLAPPRDHAALSRIAAALGSDVPACLAQEPVVASGRGERLAPAPDVPPIDAVLVNPGVPSPTAEVFDAFDRLGAAPSGPAPALRDRYDADQLLRLIHSTRNDLEPAAIGLQPAIGEALARLRGQPQTLVARMSGSGATVFALCRDRASAEALSWWLSTARPGWWVRAVRLGGPWN